jgi:hypothetical protein
MKDKIISLIISLVFSIVFLGAISLTNNEPQQPVYKVAIIDKNKVIHARQAELVNGYLTVRLDGK